VVDHGKRTLGESPILAERQMTHPGSQIGLTGPTPGKDPGKKFVAIGPHGVKVVSEEIPGSGEGIAAKIEVQYWGAKS